MRAVIAAVVLGLCMAGPAVAADEKTATVYKSPTCGCCKEYIAYLQTHGYKVKAIDVSDLDTVKRQHGIPPRLESCHTTIVGGYVVEGHVPVTTLNRLLAERPKIKGVALPGMPQGSPGMSGTKQEPFVMYELAPGAPRVYATE